MDDKRHVMDRFTLNVNIISLKMRLLCYLDDLVFWWNDLLNGTSDVWKYLNDKKFVQILSLHGHHYVVITNLELSTEETNTVYIFYFCTEFSYRKMDKNKKYPISFIKTCCNFLRKTQRKISFKLMNVCQANSLPSNGYYVIMYAYTLFCNLDIFSLKVSQERISLLTLFRFLKQTKSHPSNTHHFCMKQNRTFRWNFRKRFIVIVVVQIWENV